MAESDDTDRSMLQARFNDRVNRRMVALEEHVAKLSSAFKAAIDGTSDDPDTRPAGPVSWLLLEDTPLGHTLMADLCDWLTRVYLRYPGDNLPSCWLWHPDVIEELLWLRHAHALAYTGRQASWLRVADWHDRYRPRVADRIRKSAGHCELHLHAASGSQARLTPALPLPTAAPRLTAHWTQPDSHTATRPEPTPDELTEADTYQNSSYPTN